MPISAQLSFWSLLCLAKPEGELEPGQKIRRHGHRAKNIISALFEAVEDDTAFGEIDPFWRKRQSLRETAAGVVKSLGKKSGLGRQSSCSFQEVSPLFGIEIEPPTIGIVKPHFTHVEHYT